MKSLLISTAVMLAAASLSAAQAADAVAGPPASNSRFATPGHEFADVVSGADLVAQCPRVVFIKKDIDPKPYGHATLPTFDSQKFGVQICVYDPATPKTPPAVIFSRDDGQIYDMNLNYEGTKLLFAYRDRDYSQNYHIHEINIDGTGLRRVIAGPFMDVSPQYLPDGRIVFISSRSKAYGLCQPHEMTGIFTMNPDGSDIVRIGYGSLAETSPAVLDDGRVLYTRWEYVDKDVCLQQGLWTVHPDGRQVALYYGNTITVPPVMWQARQIPGTHKVLATLCAHHGYPVGPLGIINNRKGLEETAALTCITPDEPLTPSSHPFAYPEVVQRSDPPRVWSYRDPCPVSKNLFLCAYGGPAKDGPKRYRLFLLDDRGRKAHLYGDGNIHCFNPLPLIPRPKPAAIAATRSRYEQATGTFFVQDVYAGALAGVPRGTVKEIRVMSQLPKSRNTLDPRAYAHGPTISMGSTYFVKVCYGSAPVAPDGSAYFEAPTGVNLYFQAIDKDGKEILRMGTETQLMPGENQSCAGCHVDPLQSPRLQPNPGMARPMNTGPVTLTPPPWGEAGPVDFVKQVQPVFERYCVECHSGSDPKGRLDLSGDKSLYFNMAYAHLVGWEGSRFCLREALTNSLVWWTDGNWGGQTGNYKPYKSGSHLSRLCTYLENGHGDVKVDDNSRRRVYAWIDSHVPYYGTYDCSRPGAQGGRFCWPQDSFSAFTSVFNKNCAACHGAASQGHAQGTIRESWINLTHPERSKVLNAHLAKEAGGWGLIGEKNNGSAPVMTRESPLYRTMLVEIKTAAAALASKPRVDMPGATPVMEDVRYNNRYPAPAAKPIRAQAPETRKAQEQ
jgi:mono/diheme cytochrome c family protein